ncbi:hypothetical protein POMI540_0346 [Schizosaccharomyces pombe]|uniref:Uncharacterized protein C630.04c n=1 Tax=Schizosaccharomyces pombe (strain 972 / ATCC 24843) TaxID=284812 RepID=YKI4_SCHPO|nr:uncharacterized protein SPAC630.04c [Schizosaccharomyces pombe]Q9UUH8.1 RecName: Full=Uncharacterized protein C630.04c [Schizosaccharomyces pombe 972h-]CAB52726.1 sequence orphan [Schizosaccharomyces pombe]|eukprot:NP_592899.1 uncharacterized protein SPAC630.04c [Schizosaccharomyces pombe]
MGEEISAIDLVMANDQLVSTSDASDIPYDPYSQFWGKVLVLTFGIICVVFVIFMLHHERIKACRTIISAREQQRTQHSIHRRERSSSGASQQFEHHVRQTDCLPLYEPITALNQQYLKTLPTTSTPPPPAIFDENGEFVGDVPSVAGAIERPPSYESLPAPQNDEV